MGARPFHRRRRCCAARVGPLPIPRGVGRRLTELEPRPPPLAFAGQGNAILVARRCACSRTVTAQPAALRRRTRRSRARPRDAARLGEGATGRPGGAPRADGGRTFLVANLHCTSSRDARLADAELVRAAWFASAAQPRTSSCSPATSTSSATPRAAPAPATTGGSRAPGPGIDHILVTRRRRAACTCGRRAADVDGASSPIMRPSSWSSHELGGGARALYRC